MTHASLAVHAQRKRRNAGCRRTVRKPLLERSINVVGYDRLRTGIIVAGTRRPATVRRDSGLGEIFSMLAWGSILRGFKKSKERKA